MSKKSTEKRRRERKKKKDQKLRQEKALRQKEKSKPPNWFAYDCEPRMLHQIGPVAVGYWSVPGALEEALHADSIVVPPPVVGVLLLDTGAQNTCMSVAVAERLGLRPTRMAEGFGAGGRHTNAVFMARLNLVIQRDGKKTEIMWEQEVQAVPDLEKIGGYMIGDQRHPLIGLIGRDILRHARFEYDGTKGKYRVAFDLSTLKGSPSR